MRDKPNIQAKASPFRLHPVRLSDSRSQALDGGAHGLLACAGKGGAEEHVVCGDVGLGAEPRAARAEDAVVNGITEDLVLEI